MSFLTGTNMELIYASTSTGTAKNTFTTEVQINDTAGMGAQCHLPPDFWLPNRTQSPRGLRIIARGILSSTATPTYTFAVRSGAAGSTNTCILIGSAALTTTSGAANQPWEMIGDIIVTSIGAAGANTSVRSGGMMRSPGLNPTIAGLWAANNGTTPAAATTATSLDTSITNYINFNVACSASSASNTITLQSLQVYGLN